MKARDIIVSRKTTNEDVGDIIAGGKKLVSKKLLPAVGFTDAAMRAQDGDYIGAGLGTIAGGLALVPPVPPYGTAAQAGSIGLDALNQLRDVAKERGGWGNLGKDIYQSIKTQEYDPSFLPEDFEELDQLERAGKLDEAGLVQRILQYGPEAGAWLKNLVTRKKPDVTPPKAPDVTPPKAPEVPPPKVHEPKGDIDLTKEFKRIEAERAAKAEAEAAERAAAAKAEEAAKAAAEEERIKNLELPKRKWGPTGRESDKDYIDRLQKMGPEYVAKKMQQDQAIINAKTAAELSKSKLRRGIEAGGKAGLKYIGGPVAAGAALKYGWDHGLPGKAWDWSKEKIQDIDTTGGNPLPHPYDVDSNKPTPSPDSSSSSNTEPTEKVPADSEKAPVTVPPVQSDEPPRKRMFGDQSRAPSKEEPLSEKQEQYSKKQYIAWAAKYAKLYDVPLPVVLHAMRKETGIYDADTAATIRGPKTKYGQAVGVMQLMPTFFKTLKPEDFTNPEKNIEAGTRFLARLYNTYGSAEAALAAYNAGPNNPKFTNWLKSQNPKDLPAQTREYVYGDPRKKTVGFVNNVDQQVALLAPETAKDKIARVATDVVAAATGSNNAQAANSEKSKSDQTPRAAQYPRAGTPVDKVALPGHYTNPVLQPQDGRVHMQMQDLSSTFRTALDKALADYAKDNPGAKITVTSGVRTIEDQKRLYAQAQAEKKKMEQGLPNNYRVTASELAGHAGYAIDMNTPDLVKLTKWLKKNDPDGKKYGLRSGLDFNDDVHLELRNWEEVDKARRDFNAKQPKNKQIASAAEWEEYNQRIEQERLALANKDKNRIDPLTGAPEAKAGTSQADKPESKPAVKSKPPVEVPSVDDFGNVIEPGKIQKKAEKPADKPADKDKPKAKTRTTTDATGKETTYTQNEKGQWVDPRGNIMPTPEKPGSRKDLEITDKGGEPSAADVEKSRNITGRKDPLIDPDTGFPTTEKALRDKLAQRAADEKAAADKEAKRIADLDKAQRDAEAKKKAEKSIDKDAGKADNGKQPPLVIPPELKNRIDKDSKKKDNANPPVVIPPELKNLEKDTARKDFEQAFKAARDEKGPGNTFTWKNPLTGKEGTYTTDYKKEKKVPPVEKPADNKVDNKVDNNKKLNPITKKFEPEEPNKVEKPADTDKDKDILNQLTKKDSWDVLKNAPVSRSIKIDPSTGNASDSDTSLPPVKVDAKPEKANVWRDSSGRPVTSGTGEPWGTGTSDKDDIEAAKIELQRQAEIDKAKGKLQDISPDLSKPPESSWKDMWDRGIENLTGKKRMTSDELNTIRVPESVNNELADILRLAGRKK